MRPRVTIISVGAATDAIPLPNAAGTLVACCEEAWVRAYSRRVRGMMKTYLRDGHARVFWLTPPFPKAPARAQITYAVDDAITRAGRGLQGRRRRARRSLLLAQRLRRDDPLQGPQA